MRASKFRESDGIATVSRERERKAHDSERRRKKETTKVDIFIVQLNE